MKTAFLQSEKTQHSDEALETTNSGLLCRESEILSDMSLMPADM